MWYNSCFCSAANKHPCQCQLAALYLALVEKYFSLQIRPTWQTCVQPTKCATENRTCYFLKPKKKKNPNKVPVALKLACYETLLWRAKCVSFFFNFFMEGVWSLILRVRDLRAVSKDCLYQRDSGLFWMSGSSQWRRSPMLYQGNEWDQSEPLTVTGIAACLNY